MHSLSMTIIFLVGIGQGWDVPHKSKPIPKPHSVQVPQYLPDRLAVRLSPEAMRMIDLSSPHGMGSIPWGHREGVSRTGIVSLDEICSQCGITEFRPLFSHSPTKKDAEKLRRWCIIKFPKGDIEQIIRELKMDPNIEKVNKIGIRYTRLVPDDSYYSYQWYLSQASDHDIDAPEAWDHTTGDNAVIIGIIDTGILFGHEDIFDNIWHNSGEDAWTDPSDPTTGNGTDDDDNGLIDDWIGYDWVDYSGSDAHPSEDATTPDNDPSDFNGHGTYCAGVASGVANNSTGIAGVGWQCRMMCLRAGLSISSPMGGEQGILVDDAIAEAITYGTDMGVDILLLAWGGMVYSDLINDAVNYAIGNGVLFVKAADNWNSDNPDFLDERDDILSVAATDLNDYKASFSDYGEWVDVSAPGVDILTTSSYHYTPGYDTIDGSLMGTSVAASIVAGVGALVKAAYPTMEGPEIFQRIVDNADNIDELNLDYEGMLGSGRVNAQWAVYTPFNDVGVTDVFTIPGDPKTEENVAIRATIKNSGSNSQAGFPVYAEISKLDAFFSESFDHGGSDPTGWDIQDGGSQTGPPGRWHPVLEGGSDYYMESNSEGEGEGATQDEELISPSIDCSGKTGVLLRFWIQYRHYYGDTVNVDVSSDGGTNWTTVKTFSISVDPGKIYTLNISSIADNQSDVKIRFHYIASYCWWWRIDDVELLYPLTPAYADTTYAPLISPGDSVEVTFPHSWIPTEEGKYLLRGWTELAGDEREENDRKKKEITVLPSIKQPDNHIRNGDEVYYIGDDIYDDIGNQTKSQDVVNNDTAVYHIRIQNDGNIADSFLVTGTAGSGQWEVTYFDSLYGGNDITSQLTGSGWSTGSLDPGQYREIRAEVVADWFWQEVDNTILVTSISQADDSKTDIVRANTGFLLVYQPDNLIKNLDETSYIGGDVYNDDGTDQTKEQKVLPGNTATYHIRIENDGSCPGMFQVVGTPGGGNWTVKYYDALNGGNDITDSVIDPIYGWAALIDSPPALKWKEIRAEVTADPSTPEGDSITTLITTFASGDISKKDVVEAVTSISPLYAPDNLIKNGDETNYAGDDVYNLDGTNQTKSQTAGNNEAAVYHIRIENDGRIEDSFLIKGTSGSEGWMVSYFDALTGGDDITSLVTGSGWSTGNLGPGDTKEVRVEMIPDETVPGGGSFDVLITATSEGNGEKKDAVKATTRVTVLYQPDNQVKNYGETAYMGDDVYNTTGAGQTKNQAAAPNQTAIYHINIENDGNTQEDMRVTGDAGADGWVVRYFDALSGGNDITSQITGVGWLINDLNPGAFREIRVEMTPGPDVPEDSSFTASVTSAAEDDGDKKDVVKVMTTSTDVGIEDRYYNIPNFYILYPTFPSPFAGHTTIKYGLPVKDKVVLEVYDISGKLVRTLVDEEKEPGYYIVLWDGRDNLSKELPNGIYFIRLEAPEYKATRKVVLLVP